MISLAMREHVEALLRSYVGRGIEAGDLRSSAFITLHRAAHLYEQRDNCSFWTYARPFVISSFLKEIKRMAVNKHETYDDQMVLNDSANDETVLLNDVVEHAIENETDREMLMLKAIEQKPISEIAKQVNLPENEVRQRIHDSLKKLTQYNDCR